MGYNKEWIAICPRCDKKLTHADYTCTNCEKGKIKISEHRQYGSRSINFGCEKCGQAYPYMKCNKCGALLHEKVVKTAGCFIATAVFGYESNITIALRTLRDKVIIKIPGGRAFVFLYYKNSQKLLTYLYRKSNDA